VTLIFHGGNPKLGTGGRTLEARCLSTRVTMWCLPIVVHLVVICVDCRATRLGTACGRNTDIHIIGFFPCTHSNDTRGFRVDNCDGIDRIPIMKLALEEINARCDLLRGYRLVVDYANSAVSNIFCILDCIRV